MELRWIVTAVVFAYVTSFIMHLNAAVVDISVHIGTSLALNCTSLTPQGVFVRVTRLRRIGMLPGSVIAAVYFAAASPQLRRKRTRLVFQLSTIATTLAGYILLYATCGQVSHESRMILVDIGFILFGFGDATTFNFGYSFLYGDTVRTPDGRQDVLIDYQTLVGNLGRISGLGMVLVMYYGWLPTNQCFVLQAIVMSSASVAAFGLGTYLRQFDADSRMANDEDDVYEGLRWDVYRSRGFLKGLLLASVPLSLSEHFNDAWAWTKDAIFERAELDKSTFATTVLWKHLAWGGTGVLGFAYRLLLRKYNAKKGLAGLKREMSWLALVSPVVIAACIMYSHENIDYTANWFVIIDTILTEPFTPAAFLTPECFPGETKAVGLCLAKAIRYAWKLVAEPLVVASLDLLGIQSFFVTVLALRMLCSIVIFFSKPTAKPTLAESEVIASASVPSADVEPLYEHLRDLTTTPESGEHGYEHLRDMTSALTDRELQRLRELSSLSCGAQHARAHEYLHLRDMGTYYSIE